MATIDKINEALAEMQNDLAKLQHYTGEIGKAQTAATEVVKVSREYVISFQQRVKEIGILMDDASQDFKAKCNSASLELNTTSTNFQKGINDAKKSLSEVGVELSNVALKVNTLAQKIDSIDIEGHFNRVYSGLQSISEEQSKIAVILKQEMASGFDQAQIFNQKNRKLIYVAIIISLLLTGVSVYLAFLK